MLTPVNECRACGFYGAMNQGIRLNWGQRWCPEWTCIGCVAWAQEILLSRGMQFDPREFRTYYYLPA
jgi:hypothetical protein